MRMIRNSPAVTAAKDPALAAALKDQAEIDYLNQQPTSFALPGEAVDRLRAAAGTIIMASPEFQRLLKDLGARVVTDPSRPRAATAVPSGN
jgi:NTE family protein